MTGWDISKEQEAGKWRVPYTRKEYYSLTDVAASVIHPFYKGMKKKINT